MYAPPPSAQSQRRIPAPVLSHVQSGSSRRAQVREDATVQHGERTMPPPPPPGAWDTTTGGPARTPQVEATLQHIPQRPSFRPPATPQAASSSSSQRFILQTPSRTTSNTPTTTSRTFPEPHLKSQSQIQRFIPSSTPRSIQGSRSAASPRATGMTPSTPRRLASTTPGPSGQRAPFIHGTSAGYS